VVLLPVASAPVPGTSRFTVYLSMAISISKLKSKLSGLNKSLDELEAQLEPLFAQSLPETAVGLEVIQQAKLNVLVPYITYDLIYSEYPFMIGRQFWLLIIDQSSLPHSIVYLKTKGINPMTHPVIQELVRRMVDIAAIHEAHALP
jgi:exosome complex protein LRP1